MKRFPFQKLEEFLDELNFYYAVNAGGCAYVAYVIARKFEELGISYRVVLYYPEFKKFPAKYFLENSRSVRHVMLYARRHYINCITPDTRTLRRQHITMTSKEILEYYHSSQWNDWYDTDCNGEVEESINEFFKKLEK